MKTLDLRLDLNGDSQVALGRRLVEQSVAEQLAATPHLGSTDWNARLAAVREFAIQTGSMPQARSEDAFESVLGYWMNLQTSLIKTGRLPQPRQILLLEMQRRVDPHIRWARQLEAVTGFLAERGRLPAKGSGPDTERALGIWVHTQRAAYRAGRLPVHRETVLRSAEQRLRERVFAGV